MFTARANKYEKYRPLRGGIYIIEGLIGVGKSTLGTSLEHYLNSHGIKCKFFLEYTNKLLLDQYITNMQKYAYTFQLVMLMQRIQTYRDAIEFAQTGGVALIDRSIFGDMAFAYMQKEKGFISEDEWKIYLNIMRTNIQLEPSAIIYLTCDITNCLSRLNKRGEQVEISGYNNEYYNSLQKAYEYVINHYNTSRLIQIDWNKSSDFDGIHLKNEVLDEFLALII